MYPAYYIHSGNTARVQRKRGLAYRTISIRDMNGNFVIYLVGYIIVIIGVAYGMSAAGLGSQWIVPVVLVLIGLGIVWALSRSQRDTATRQQSSTPQQTSNVQSSPRDQGSTGDQGSPSTQGQHR